MWEKIFYIFRTILCQDWTEKVLYEKDQRQVGEPEHAIQTEIMILKKFFLFSEDVGILYQEFEEEFEDEEDSEEVEAEECEFEEVEDLEEVSGNREWWMKI